MTEFFKLVFQLVLLFLTQAFIAVGTPFMFLVLYFLQKLYLHTSRQVRFLDIELRAEVFSNFLETVGSLIASMLRFKLTPRSWKGSRTFEPLAGKCNPSIRTSKSLTYLKDLTT